MGVHTIEPLPHKFPNPQQLHHSRDCPIWLAPGQTSPGDEVKNEDVKGGSFLEWHAWVLWTWKGQQKIQNVNPFERAWKNLPFGTSIQPCLESTPPSWDQKSFSRSLKCVCQFAAMRIHGRGYRQGSGRVHKKKMQNTKKLFFHYLFAWGSYVPKKGLRWYASIGWYIWFYHVLAMITIAIVSPAFALGGHSLGRPLSK